MRQFQEFARSITPQSDAAQASPKAGSLPSAAASPPARLHSLAALSLLPPASAVQRDPAMQREDDPNAPNMSVDPNAANVPNMSVAPPADVNMSVAPTAASPTANLSAAAPVMESSASNKSDGRTQPPDSSTLLKKLSIYTQIMQLKRMFFEQRYGCWCGPGNVCDKPIDDIDTCCQTHDKAYAQLGVSSTPGPGEVDMWDADGLVKTRDADLALVTSTAATLYDKHYYGNAALDYRASVALIFGGRAAYASTIMAANGPDLIDQMIEGGLQNNPGQFGPDPMDQLGNGQQGY